MLVRIKDSGDYSDLTIVCGKSEFKVHRAIVCPQSGFFRAACNEGFKVGAHILFRWKMSCLIFHTGSKHRYSRATRGG